MRRTKHKSFVFADFGFREQLHTTKTQNLQG